MSDKKITMPHSPESEKQVIGTLLSAPEVYKKISHIVTANDFYTVENKYIFQVIEKLIANGEDVDIMSVGDSLKLQGKLDQIGGLSHLTYLSNEVIVYAHVVTHARIVAKRAVLRNILQAGADIVRMSQGDMDLDELLVKSEARLKGVTRAAAQSENRLATVDLEEWREKARKDQPPPGSVRGISLGYKGVDDITEGMEPGEMLILTGHTKHGKSQLATNIAYNVAEQGKTILFINTEMTKLQIARRFNGIAGEKKLKGKIILNDRSALLHTDAIHLMERAKEKGCDLVIVDHLHFFARSLDNEAAVLSSMTKQFKEAATEFELPLIMLAHVSQSDTKKIPTLQSLKGSSSIAQDADIVLTVWRDDRPNATNPGDIKVTRLAHRSSNNAKRSTILYSDGIRLAETVQKQEQEIPNLNDRILGEKDELDDIDFSW